MATRSSGQHTRVKTMSTSFAGRTSVVLYDGARGGTPDTQGQLIYRTSPSPSATHTFADGMTMLDTILHQRDAAGYMVDPAAAHLLDRASGYVLSFAVQIVAETHAES